MAEILVEGGNPLVGTVKVSGSKNSALKIIAAALLCNEDVTLENVPRIENVEADLGIIEALGGKVEWLGSNKLLINGAGVNTHEIPYDLGSKYRTASLHAAALAFRFGKATIPFPVGSKIGPRPIDRWVSMWETLGISVTNDDKNIYLDAENIAGAHISFQQNTHMGTDMAILFSAFAPGETIINNAAEEPEVDDVIDFINLIGGNVERLEARRIKVVGNKQFNGGTFTIQPDRNEVVTYASAALVTNGNVTIKGVNKAHLLSFVNVLTKMEVKFEIDGDEMRVWRSGEELVPTDVATAPYPGFMTDWQPLITLLLTQVSGASTVYDTIYWDRFGYTSDLNRMGARIELVTPSEMGLDVVVSDYTYDLKKQGEPKSVAKIAGGTKLRGTKLHIPDLRAGATLILAALAAEGKSEITGFENVTRGYEDFVSKFIDLGANISSV
jgi:UDP-N-acetylglucosamine 1-carboxyvinyltransferase